MWWPHSRVPGDGRRSSSVVKNPNSQNYKRRTFDECREIALNEFASNARGKLSLQQFEYCITRACLSGSSPYDGWSEHIGYEPERRMHFEITIADWLEDHLNPKAEPRVWVRIIVSRDRLSNFCHIIWLSHLDWIPPRT